MYSTCIFCHSELGANEVIESFPVGRRLAFDAATGRLWVICRKCERWNLTPIEERWEAVEQCERLFTQTRLRVSSDNIGLSRLSEGLELVRIGRPLRPEMASWRYGDQFGRRRRKHLIVTGAVGVIAAGVLIAGPATGIIASGGYGMFQLVNGLQRAARDRIVRARVSVPTLDRPTVLRGKDMRRIVLANHGDTWSIRVPYHGGSVKKAGDPQTVTFTGAVALRAASTLLPAVNLTGGKADDIALAVRQLDETADTHRLFLRAAGETAVRKGGRRGQKLGANEIFLDRLPNATRLALEMAAHEDIERRAMEGELSILETAWRDADEIASIADSLLLPVGVDEQFELIKQR